jgi:hypothetical protein
LKGNSQVRFTPSQPFHQFYHGSTKSAHWEVLQAMVESRLHPTLSVSKAHWFNNPLTCLLVVGIFA